MAKTGGLGLGLDALFDDNSSDFNVKKTLRTSEIEPNRKQPRRQFNESSLAPLADSIQEFGVLQPILVRQTESGAYQIVAGERRWRAARMVGLAEVPVIIREFDDKQTMQIALIENLQRENLNPIEEALGFNELIEVHDMTQEQVSKIIGCSRASVTNSLRMLNLPDEVQAAIKNGSVSAGHAKVLLGVDDEETLIMLAKKVAEDKVTVRALEVIVKNLKKPEKVVEMTDNYYKEMELSLHENLGRKVKVSYFKDKGSLTLEFYNKEDLQNIAEKLTDEY